MMMKMTKMLAIAMLLCLCCSALPHPPSVETTTRLWMDSRAGEENQLHQQHGSAVAVRTAEVAASAFTQTAVKSPTPVVASCKGAPQAATIKGV